MRSSSTGGPGKATILPSKWWRAASRRVLTSFRSKRPFGYTLLSWNKGSETTTKDLNSAQEYEIKKAW